MVLHSAEESKLSIQGRTFHLKVYCFACLGISKLICTKSLMFDNIPAVLSFGKSTLRLIDAVCLTMQLSGADFWTKADPVVGAGWREAPPCLRSEVLAQGSLP